MKITRSQLKRIIKEEMQRTLLTESIDLKNDYPNIWKHIVIPLQCEIVSAYSEFNVTCGANGPADADWVNADNNELHHRNEVIKFEIPDEVWPESDAEEIFADGVKYPNGLKLTMIPSTVPDGDIQNYVMQKRGPTIRRTKGSGERIGFTTRESRQPHSSYYQIGRIRGSLYSRSLDRG